MTLMKRIIEARNLPPGHYGRTQLAADIQKEYQLCTEFEKRAKIPYVHLTSKEAAATCALITTKLGIKKLKKLVLNSERANGAIAIYSNSEIHFSSDYITLITLLHEIAHHVHRNGGFNDQLDAHGKGFIESFELVVRALKS